MNGCDVRLKHSDVKLSFLNISVILLLVLSIVITGPIGSSILSFAQEENKKQIIITAILDDLGQIGKKERWQLLFGNALSELKARHSGLDIKINFIEFPGNESRVQILNALTSRTSADIVSVDQIWLGEFAEKGLITDLTNYTDKWGRQNDWYEVNWDGGAYNDKIYGIWAWTDVRGIWYWKDLLKEAGVEPESLKTWDGYIASAKKLDATLKDEATQGVHLSGVETAVDMWYPYLWMDGGAILESRPAHPTKEFYWFPRYNSTVGVRALDFIKDQIDAGIEPQQKLFDTAFAQNKSFAVMLGGSWMPGEFPRNQWPDIGQKLGFIPMFPVPASGNDTATTMGGWLLSIPEASTNKDLSWELITIVMEPRLLATWLERYGYLPTQIPIGQKIMLADNLTSFPYYKEMISMIPFGHSRPSIPEYPEIANHIKQALDDIYNGTKEPEQALDDAAAKSARLLGW